MDSHFSLSGKTFLVTGSTTGLGRAMACALGAAGAKVAMNFRNDVERAEAAFADFQNQGYEGALFRASVIDEGDITRLRQEIESQLGPVDGFIVNATPAQPLKPIEEYDWEFYQSMIDFFIKSPYLLTREFLPHMREQKWGRIINIASEVFTQIGRAHV